MLGHSEVMAMTATTRPEDAKAFYRDVLGLALQEDTPFALVFSAPGSMIRVQKVERLSPHPFTALGWTVSDIRAMAERLLTRGVACERFDGLQQDTLGVWAAPGGDQMAWFKDPDGNILSLTQFA